MNMIVKYDKSVPKYLKEEMNKIKLPKNVVLEESELNFYQPSDSMQAKDIGQELKVKVTNAGAGNYLIIETKRWAIDCDEIDQLADLLKQIIGFTGEE